MLSTRTDKDPVPLKQALIELSIMLLVGATIPILVYLDMVVLFADVGEKSLTEASQMLLLATSTALFASGAIKRAEASGYLWSMASLSLLMAIRESDGLLDRVGQGFWVYPAIICIAAGLTATWRNRNTLGSGFLQHYSSRHGTLVFLGLLFLIVFSRAFGSGDLWRAIMAESYTQEIKSAIQEGLELLGYAIFAFGTMGSWRRGFR